MKLAQKNGLFYLVQGFQLIRTPGVKRYVFIPLFINILIFAGLFFYAQHLFGQLTQWLINWLPHWLQWLGSILWLLFFVGFFFLMLYTFITIANIIAAPFNSFLAEKIEFHLTGQERKGLSFIKTLKDTPRIMGRQFSILGYYLPRAILLFILFFIPIVQLIAPILWFLFHAWLMTLQFVDYPTDNQRIPIKNVQERLNEKRLLSYTFGGSTLFLSMIPILNFFVMPAAVAGATKMWVEEFSSPTSSS